MPREKVLGRWVSFHELPRLQEPFCLVQKQSSPEERALLLGLLWLRDSSSSWNSVCGAWLFPDCISSVPPGVPLAGELPRGNLVLLPSQIYPDESHYFHSVALKQHLYRSIINFFVECFRIQDKLPTATAKEDEEED